MQPFGGMLQNTAHPNNNGDQNQWTANTTQNGNSEGTQVNGTGVNSSAPPMTTIAPQVNNPSAENADEESATGPRSRNNTAQSSVSVGTSDIMQPTSSSPPNAGATPANSPMGGFEHARDLGVGASSVANRNHQSMVAGPVAVEPPLPPPHVTQALLNLKIEITDGVIATNSSFKSFAEFERAFSYWKATYLHPFRVASSEQLRNADGTIDNVFKYKYIVYHCAHYGRPRMRGSGKRPNQNYLPCGCKAMLRLNYAYNTGLRITTLNDKHTGHEVTPESYAKSCSKIRRYGARNGANDRRNRARHQQHDANRGLVDNPRPGSSGTGRTNRSNRGNNNRNRRRRTSSNTANNTNNINSNSSNNNNSNSGSNSNNNSNSNTAAMNVLSHIQRLDLDNSSNPSVDYDEALAALAKNVARLGTGPSPQNIFQSCQSPNTNGLQNLAAVAAAVGQQQQQQQQQAAAALLSQQKENLGFAFQNLSIIQQQAEANPSLLPLIRGALGIPNFTSPLPFPFQGSLNNIANNTTANEDPLPSSTGNSSFMAAQQSPHASAFAQFLNYQQQQQYLQQQQSLAAAISLAQSLRNPFFNSPFLTSPTIPSQDAQMPEQTQELNYQGLSGNIQTSTPIDLSVPTTSAMVPSCSTQESDAFIQALHSLKAQKQNLSPEEYNKKVSALRDCIQQVFPSWDPNNSEM